ncbi:MAG: hypothetical protein Q7S13_03455 [Candidatus Omnitrophota bacterium]|nr:hypothetical protein [Candidatus Omnitrophota bacterium]
MNLRQAGIFLLITWIGIYLADQVFLKTSLGIMAWKGWAIASLNVVLDVLMRHFNQARQTPIFIISFFKVTFLRWFVVLSAITLVLWRMEARDTYPFLMAFGTCYFSYLFTCIAFWHFKNISYGRS